MSTAVADEATDVVVTPNGDALVVGLNGTNEPSNRLFVRRYGGEGDLRWTHQVNHCRNPPPVVGEIEEDTLLNCNDRSNVRVATDGAGNAYVLSQTFEEKAYCCGIVRTYLTKLGAAGRPLWDKQLEVFTSYSDGPRSGNTGPFVTDFTVNEAGKPFSLRLEMRL